MWFILAALNWLGAASVRYVGMDALVRCTHPVREADHFGRATVAATTYRCFDSKDHRVLACFDSNRESN
jgi:hypothetical protein